MDRGINSTGRQTKRNECMREKDILFGKKKRISFALLTYGLTATSARSPFESSGGARLGSFLWDQLDSKTWIIRGSRVFRPVHKGVSFEGHRCHRLTLCRLLEGP